MVMDKAVQNIEREVVRLSCEANYAERLEISRFLQAKPARVSGLIPSLMSKPLSQEGPHPVLSRAQWLDPF